MNKFATIVLLFFVNNQNWVLQLFLRIAFLSRLIIKCCIINQIFVKNSDLSLDTNSKRHLELNVVVTRYTSVSHFVRILLEEVQIGHESFIFPTFCKIAKIYI